MPIPQYPFSTRQYEPLRDNLYVVDFTGVPFFTKDSQNKLQYQVRGTAIPAKTLHIQTDAFTNQQSSYADMEEQTGRRFTITFEEIYETDNIRDILNEWFNTCFNKTTFTQGSKIEYAWDLYLMLIGLNKEVFREFKLIRAFPETIGEVSLSYPRGGGSGNLMTFDVTFVFDYFDELKA